MKRNSDNFAAGIGDGTNVLDKNSKEGETAESLEILGRENKNSSLESIAENEKKEQVFQELEILGFIQKEGEKIIFDVDRFKNEFSKKFINANKKLKSFSVNFGDRKMAPTLHKLFSDYKIISRSDWEKGINEPKDLFYFPKNSNDALDIEKIKQSQFYLTLQDVIGNVAYRKIKYGSIEDIDYREVLLPVLIYHPQYGDGYRDDKTEVLMVKKKGGKYGKISSEYLRINHGNLRDGDGLGIDSGRKFLRKVAPHLLEKDLIRLSDFQIKTEQGTKTENNHRKVGTRGTVMFNNVRHTLGTQYENALAYKISETMGVVVQEDGDKKVVLATFDILSEEQAQTSSTQNYKIANIKQSNPVAFDEYSFKNKNKDETLEEYKERIETMESFEYVLQSEKYLRDELGITLEKFSPKEQAMIAKMLNSVSVLQKKKIDDFIIQYGDNGLKTFLSLKHGGNEMGNKIIKIGERLDTEKADMIFSKYVELSSVAEDVEKYINNQFSRNKHLDKVEITHKLLVTAKELLEKYADNISAENVDEFASQLNKINARVELTREIIGQLPRESVAQLDLTQLSDIERHIDLKAQDLMKMPELMKKMEKIVENNFTKSDREAFSQYCLSSENSGLTVTTTNGEVLSFFMKKKLADNLSYLNWFSTNPDALIKGLGEATVLLGFNHSKKEQESFYAVAKPYVKSYGTLIEKLGFVGFGKAEIDEYDGNHYARARKIPSDTSYASKSFSPEQNVNFTNQLKNICLDENRTHTLTFENKNYLVCKVSYAGYTHKDNLTGEDEDGWLYREIEKQSGEQRVLTRYIPNSVNKNNTTYYAVFEKDASTEEERKELDHYLISSNLSHSD